MTNEEKIIAYDEALERAKEIMDNTCSSETTKVTCQEIFPELTENAESEYERIRKAIIGHLKNDVDFVCNGITKDECLAWLEKQKDRLAPIYEDIDSFESALGKAWKDYNDSGARIVDGCEDDYVECAHAKGFREGYLFGVEKQKDASKAIEAADRIDKYIDMHVANAHDMKDSNPDKKYYRGWDDALGKMAGILQDVYSEKKQKEQKPVDLVAELKLHLANTPKEQLEKEWKELEPYGNIGPTVHEFLYGEQPAEWSEEDENMLNSIINVVCGVGSQPNGLREKQVRFLKSLRPQPHWKPTDEQMEALDYAITGDFDKIPPTSYLSRRLEEIEEFLKTL